MYRRIKPANGGNVAVTSGGNQRMSNGVNSNNAGKPALMVLL